MVQNLSDISVLSKKVLTWSIIAVISLILLWATYKGALLLKSYLSPPVQTHHPFAGVDKLPPLSLPAQRLIFTSYQPTLDTADQKLPLLPVFFNVFETLSEPASLLGAERTANVAKAFGIESAGVELPDGKIRYQEIGRSGLNQSLTVDPKVLNFSYRTNYQTAAINFERGLPAFDNAVSLGKSYLNTARSQGSDLTNDQAQVVYLLLNSGQEKVVPSASDANIARVIFNRQPIQIKSGDQDLFYPIVNSEKYGLVNVTFGKAKVGTTQINAESILVDMNVNYKNIVRELPKETEPVAPVTYPIFTSSEAWEKFKAGESVPLKGDFEIYLGLDVKDISLGFYDSAVEQKYLQPVIIFRGEGHLPENKRSDFMSFLPALKPEFVDSSIIVTPSPSVPEVTISPKPASGSSVSTRSKGLLGIEPTVSPSPTATASASPTP